MLPNSYRIILNHILFQLTLELFQAMQVYLWV